VLLADHVRAENLGEQLELRLAGCRRALGDVEDRAVVLAQADRAVGAESHVGEIALVGLDDRQLADAVHERRILADAFGHLLSNPVTKLASSCGEHLVEQVVATDRLDSRQQAGGQRVVVRREQVLSFSRDVVQVARPADAMPNRLARDEVGRLERSELLEDAGAARAEAFGELIGRARTIEPKAKQELAAERRRTAGRQQAVGDGRHADGLGPGARVGHCDRLAPVSAGRGAGGTLGPMDLDLSPEHVLLRGTIRDFMLTEVAPVIDEHERERRFPIEIVRRIGALGWLGIPFPEDEGGAGLDTLAYAIAIEEIGRVWGSLGLIVAAHTSLGCGPLHLAGTAEQQQTYLVPMARGEVIGAYGLTEPGAGSDSGGTRTTARLEDGPDGGWWVLDGGKRFITNAGQAGTYVVTARTGTRDDGNPEISAFIVPADTPGFSVGRLEDKLGLHASATGELLFDGARIPASNLLGQRGGGFKTFLQILDGGRISIGALAVGIAQGALDASIPYAQTREQFGRPIGTFQGVAFMIADMATEIEAARGLVWRAAWLKDQGRDFGLVAAQAKLFASEVSSRVTNNAIQIHGGYGYVTEYPVERYLRDAKLTEIGEGTSQVQRLVIGRRILGLRVV
jgi:alkylation response protein AidB-like acyl-CoA dehydrogenase